MHQWTTPTTSAVTDRAYIVTQQRPGTCRSAPLQSPDAREIRSAEWKAEMGNYMVNGEIIDVREEQPTAADLKRHSKSVLSDWVMASMPNGKIVKLENDKPLPANAVDYSVVTPFTYGCTA